MEIHHVNHCLQGQPRAPSRRLTLGTKREQCSLYVLMRSKAMLKIFVEEAAALASITLFVGMIAIWAQVIPQL
jgi:hypothetical protein